MIVARNLSQRYPRADGSGPLTVLAEVDLEMTHLSGVMYHHIGSLGANQALIILSAQFTAPGRIRGVVATVSGLDVTIGALTDLVTDVIR